jgi:hypothetical protein
MRYGEDNYENNSLDDFSGYGGYGGLPATTYTPPAATYTPPAATYTAPMGGLTAAPYSPPELTPEFLAELQASAALMKQKIEAASDPNRNAAFDKYVADQAAKGVEVASTYTGGGGPLGSGGIFGITDFAPAFDPANPAGTTGQVVRFDPGRMNAPVVFQPGQQYVLTDASSENVVGRASSVEELQKLAAAQGNMPYGFQLYRADEQGQYQPGTQLFGETDPRTKGLMGAFVNYGLPIAAGIATAGASLIPAMAASAAASGASKLMTGYTAEDAAKAAAIAGATRGVFKGTGLEEGLSGLLSGTSSGATSSAIPAGALSGAPMSLIPAGALGGASASAIPAAAFSGLSSAALAPVAGEILVQGARNAVSPALASAITGGLTSLAPAVFDPSSIPQFKSPDVSNAETSQQNDYQPGDDPVLTSTAPRPVSTTASPLTGASSAASEGIRYIVDPAEVAGRIATEPAATEEAEALAEADRIKRFEAEAAAAAAAGALPAAAAANTGALPATTATTAEPEALAEADRIKRFEAEAAAAAAAGALPATTATTAEPEALAEAKRKEQQRIDAGLPTNLLASVGDAFVPAEVSGVEGKSLEQEQAEKSGKKGMSTYGKITGGLALLDALGNLLGGGGGGGAGAGGATGLDALAPTFRAQLPTPRGQFTPQALGQRPPGEAGRPDIDYARYGYGPARSFFNYVPETQAERDAFAATAAAAPRVGVGSVFGTSGMPAGVAPAGGSSNNIAGALLPALAKAAGAPVPLVAADSLNIDWNKFADSKMMQDLGGQFRNAIVQSATPPAPTGATDSVLRAGFEKLRAAVPGASDAELVAFLGTPEGQQELAMIFEGLGATTRAKGGSMGGKGQSRESFAVNGAGTGRSDEIPALLSDGEYVIDAETVALLGDGSGKAGAQRLDEFRAKIRKHKGRNLAKGKFSVNAKRPERYLSGGLV